MILSAVAAFVQVAVNSDADKAVYVIGVALCVVWLLVQVNKKIRKTDAPKNSTDSQTRASASVPAPAPTKEVARSDRDGLTWEYFNQCQRSARAILKLMQRINDDRELIEYVNQAGGIESLTGSKLDLMFDQGMSVVYMIDLCKAYTEAGFDVETPDRSLVTLGLVVNSLCHSKQLPRYDQYDYDEFYNLNLPLICALCKSFREMAMFDSKANFNLPRILSQSEDKTYYSQFYKNLEKLLALAAEGADLDGRPAQYEEYAALVAKHPSCDEMDRRLRGLAGGNDRQDSADKTAPEPQNRMIENPRRQLDELIGLAGVKTEVKRLTNFIAIQNQRQQTGLKCTPISYHCVFTGNPGTGKTTVARILAAIYAEMGILKKGHLVETDRSGLVAEYVGQTAVKTNKIVDSALDGVLFIDEAYSLVQGGGNDFGMEAIATLLKRMEDDRDRLVVILAGYSDEMQDFINANPGLESRFNRYINFEDYTADELLAIYKLQTAKHEYTLTPDAENAVRTTLQLDVAAKDENFGNGRHVRNLFEKTLENQASRLSALDPAKLDRDILQRIEAEDIPV